MIERELEDAMKEFSLLCGKLNADELRLPKHEASLHLTHNEHKGYYLTVAESIERNEHGYEEGCWISDGEKQRAIASNDCWTIQWYPNSPTGFCIRSAHSLDSLLFAVGSDNG